MESSQSSRVMHVGSSSLRSEEKLLTAGHWPPLNQTA